MKKKSLGYVFVIPALALILPLTSCTSGGSKEGGDAAQQAANDSQFSQEGEGDFAKTQDGGPQSQLQTDGAPAAQPTADAGAPPQDTGQDLALDGQQKPAGEGAKDDLSLDDPQPLSDGLAGTQDPAANAAPPAEPPPATDTAQAPPPTDEPLFKNDAKPEEAAPGGDVAAAPPADAPAEPPAPKAFAPLQKVKDAAFEKDGTNLNRYYIARAEDKTVKAISKKIYGGKDRSKDLKKWNSTIAKRAPKVGDKIYYQSDANPTDTQMLSVYEEAGVQPSVYTTQEGDNLRKLAKSWLGSKDSWKEVWSTNPDVDSKGDVPAGLQIKYWPSEAVATLAKNETAPPPEAGSPAPPPDAPPPPPMDAPPPMPDMADTGAPPPPPLDAVPPGSPAPASTPDVPGGAAAIAPPPPPPPVAPEAKKPKPPVATNGGESDPDTTMAMGLGAILLIAAAVLFVVLRKNRAKRVDLGQTQV